MDVFNHPAFDNHEAIHFVRDAASGLRAIIAVHSTRLGPATGGCRFWPYESEAAALTDALRLSRGMTYKNAMADLPLGGGKAVIIGDPKKIKTPELLEAFGAAVQHLDGQYVTAEDVGVGVPDMEIVSRKTRYVAGLANKSGDPSPKTAHGVFQGIRAAVAFQLKRKDLKGLRVAVQGLGHVGYHLCEELHAAGAKLVVSDINTVAVDRAVEVFGAKAFAPEDILFQPVDVLAPCALGGVLNEGTIPGLQTHIVAGAANNQLLTAADGECLRNRGILYAPDYIINAGGIINVAREMGALSETQVRDKIENIHDTLLRIFERAAREGKATSVVADELARSRLKSAGLQVAA